MQESLSHLEFVFANKDIQKAVRKIKQAYKEDKTISLNPEEVERVHQTYRQEMSDAEARTFVLVASFQNKYWEPGSIKSSVNLEAICSYRYHKGSIIVAEPITKEHTSCLVSDEQLIDMIAGRRKELKTCNTHGVPVEVEKSFMAYSPYDVVMRILNSKNLSFRKVNEELRKLPKNYVLGITSRIKSPGGLADKVTDTIFGVDKICRPDKIPTPNDEVTDVSGITFVTPDRDSCYCVLNHLKGRKNISIVYAKDYIKKPKDNGYRAINSTISYQGLYHEIQILSTEMFDWNRLHPRAQHNVYRGAIKEAREKIGQPWFDLNSQLRVLFDLKPYPTP